ncbi:unnamed protein product [Peronospora destructor]|uniref:AB hydrolase-1 domain-containing protein n=1 Tax=Peronospora destructor TaxID=86335 RepID=A0AAV0TFM1_9STRA|nr:unnamed protein product [Peronospora destructor]
MKVKQVNTFAGLGIDSERHIAALNSAPKHFSKDRIEKVTLPSKLTLEYTIASSKDELETTELPIERLVTINGFVMTKEAWALIIDLLLDQWDAKTQSKKLQILCFDNRGAGGSDAPLARYTTSLMARDTLELMNHVGWDVAHFIGGSMGDMIALELAAMMPDRVLSLTLLVTTRGAYLPHPRAWKPFLGRFSADRCSAPWSCCTQVWRALTHYVSDERLELVAKSGFPIFIIGSKQDILIPLENSMALIERLKGDHVQMLIFETGGHGAFFQFAEEIADGLAQTIKRAKL